MQRNDTCRPQSPWSAADGGLSRMLSDFVGQTASSALRSATAESTAPGLTAWESDASYAIEFDLPGIARESIEIELLENTLTISGSWPRHAPEGAREIRNERPTGEFSRKVHFSSDLDESAIHAELVDGLLRITLPKRPEVQPRKIQITPGSAVEITTPDPDSPSEETSGDDVS